jgi:hypothetical protein
LYFELPALRLKRKETEREIYGYELNTHTQREDFLNEYEP